MELEHQASQSAREAVLLGGNSRGGEASLTGVRAGQLASESVFHSAGQLSEARQALGISAPKAWKAACDDADRFEMERPPLVTWVSSSAIYCSGDSMRKGVAGCRVAELMSLPRRSV